MATFEEFPKIPRLVRECIVTEKIDGTNAQVYVCEDGTVLAGSRTRWVQPGKTTDNYGFAQWVQDNQEELRKLGPGRHNGEWWGRGIGRGYGRADRAFSLFNTTAWSDGTVRPACCDVVPILFRGPFDTGTVTRLIEQLREYGSVAQPGFMKPEGVVIFHVASMHLYKQTILGDDAPKHPQTPAKTSTTPPNCSAITNAAESECAKPQKAEV